LDATDCPIRRPTGWRQQRLYFTQKNKKHCIKYEIGVNPTNRNIVWVGGPVFGAVHNICMTRMFGLLNSIDDVEWILVDKGYIRVRFCSLGMFLFLWERSWSNKVIRNDLGQILVNKENS
jgi:hypothetical protein